MSPSTWQLYAIQLQWRQRPHDSIHDHLVNLMAQVIRFTVRVAIEMFWAAASVYALHLKHCGGRQANTEGGLLGAGIWVLRIADLLLHGKCIAQG